MRKGEAFNWTWAPAAVLTKPKGQKTNRGKVRVTQL